jgi:serine/threonine protein kinase
LKVYQKSDMDKLFKVTWSMNIVWLWLIRAYKYFQKFSMEAVTWRQLSHPNVLPFYGVFHPDGNIPRLCLVSPWMTMGNVVQFLTGISNIDCVPLVSRMNICCRICG